MKKQTIIMTVAAVLLVTATAGATAYYVDQKKPDKPAVQARAAAPVQAQQQQVRCNDGNIAGKVVGGVGGGVLASNLGKGNGKTAATIGGTLGGAYIGGEVIPLHNVTCR